MQWISERNLLHAAFFSGVFPVLLEINFHCTDMYCCIPAAKFVQVNKQVIELQSIVYPVSTCSKYYYVPACFVLS